jgi:hypothetical protein
MNIDFMVYNEYMSVSQQINRLAGDAGLKGDDGPKGDTGLKGDDGPKGDAGLKGDDGPKGDAGNIPHLFINKNNFTYTSPTHIIFDNIIDDSQFSIINDKYVYSGDTCIVLLKFNIKYETTNTYPYEIIPLKIYKNDELILDMKYGYSGGLVISDDIIVTINKGDSIVLLFNDIDPIKIKEGSFLLLQKLS